MLDDPLTTVQRQSLIQKKPFLKKLYYDWYAFLTNQLDSIPKGILLELGSGGGFLKEIVPAILTSDIIHLSHNDMVVDAEVMPFENNTLSVIFMIDVLHHIPNCRNFFSEADRTLKVGGKIIMSEPANTPFSRFFYKYLHHEPFKTKAGWEIEQATGPLSGANGAIPWIVFVRDSEEFAATYPNLKVNKIKLHTPFRYILSGGMTRMSLAPEWCFDFFTALENRLSSIHPLIAMFQYIEIEKIR